MRTIEAPGVEINEIDKSQYSPAMVGTAALVMGFANKGEDYTAMQMTSRSAWVNYYGEPDNEAERYFYQACMEVINQNGKLYCAKIPYENEARDKYVVKKYSVSTRLQDIGSVQDYIKDEPSLLNLLSGDFTRYGYGLSNLPGIPEAEPSAKCMLSTYAMTMLNLDKNIDIINRYNKKRNLRSVALPVFYKYTETAEDDNWWYFNQINVDDRLYSLFNPNSEFWKEIGPNGKSKVYFEDLNLSALDLYITENDIAVQQTNNYKPGKYIFTPTEYREAFVRSFEDVFGKSATEYTPWNFIFSKLDLANDDVVSKRFQEFMNDNKLTFTKINRFVVDVSNPDEWLDVVDDEDLYTNQNLSGGDNIPYMYATTAERCNLMAYYTATKNVLDTADIINSDVAKVMNAMNTFVDVSVINNVSTIMDVINRNELSDAPYINLSTYVGGNLFANSLPVVIPSDKVEEDSLGLTQTQVTKLVNDLENFRNGNAKDVYQKIQDSLAVGSKVNTIYVSELFDYYASNVNITSYYDTVALYETSATIDTLSTTFELSSVDGEEIPVSCAINFFDKYGNVMPIEDFAKTDPVMSKKLIDGTKFTYDDNLKCLMSEFNKTIKKPTLIKYVNKIRDLDAFKQIEDYLKKTPATHDLYMKFSQDSIESNLMYSEIRDVDDSIREYYKITSNNNVFTLPIEQIDEYKTDEDVVPPNQIYIADITRAGYDRTTDATEKECIGIIPVITTAANALVAQSIIEIDEKGASYASYQPLSSIGTLVYNFKEGKSQHNHPEFILNGDATLSDYNISSYCSREIFSNDPEIETLAQEAAGYFSTIQYDDTGRLDRDNMYNIGVIVFKAYLDASEGNKISFGAVESFVGSLDRDAVNPNTNVTTFIDTIVNSQSEYINFFSNCYASTATRKDYDEKCDILIVEPQKAGNLGFYEDMLVEDISLAKSIYDGLEKIFDKNQDINEKEIDIVCDAGISNIAQYIKTIYGAGKGKYDPASTEAAMFKLKSRNDTLTWRNTIQKYDNFCKNVRKDCMFIADGLRPFCLVGQKKIVRPTKPSNTIDANILPNVKYMTGLNTNYGAGYCDWFQKADDFTGEYFWCPPSIQAMGIYIYTDVHAEYWDAPAGLNRGIVTALDVAFSPTNRQAGTIYNNNWNYAINYPQDGIVLEGQKTFQVKPSAFDRVNVRRLFLRLERATYKVARYFVYEGNTAYTRQRLIDTLDPIFADVKLRNGIYDYKIICDESINTPEVIDRNELKVKIGIKPVKTAEFILIDFIALTTGGSFDEM